jgi:hypothetical protein
MSETVLSISLLNERLSATAVHRGEVAGTWQRQEPVTDLAGFASVLREAVQQTGYTGTAVTVVLAHQRLAQQLVESPPVKGRNLKLFLQSRVKQLKPFPSEAAWSYQPTLPTRNAQAMLLHLLPRELLDQLVQGCQQLELQCDRVIPASAILQNQLTELPLEPNEVALLAADTGGTTTVVIGRKDGQIYLGRTLSNSWNAHADRVNVDLNRTLLYVKQQFGAAVNSVWLFGDGAQNQIERIRTALRLPVKLSPVQPGPFYWNQEALEIPVGDTNNLISLEQLQAPRRRVFLRVTSVAVGVAAVGALITAAAVQLLVMDRGKQLLKLESKVEQIQVRRAALQDREREFLQKKQFVRIVSDEKVAPVPGWFLGYLGDIVPEELLLGQVRLNREDNRWHVELGGSLQPTTNQAPAKVLDDAVATLKRNLTEGPFHVQFPGERSGATGKSTQAGARTAAAPAAPALGADQFFIEGVMNEDPKTQAANSREIPGTK